MGIGELVKEVIPGHYLPGDTMYLAGDLGATTLRLALTAIGLDGKARIVLEIDYSSCGLERSGLGFDDAFSDFLKKIEPWREDYRIRGAVFAPAGPIIDPRSVALSQRPGIIVTSDSLERLLRGYRQDVQAININDFEAVGSALPYIDLESTVILNQGKGPGRIIGCIGPGSGLGAVYTKKGSDGTWESTACEGGHVTAALSSRGFENLLSRLILDYREKQLGEDPILLESEDFVSGRGIADLFSAYSDIVVQDGIDDLIPNVDKMEVRSRIGILMNDYLVHKAQYDVLFGEVKAMIHEGRATDVAAHLSAWKRQGFLLIDETFDTFFRLYGRAARDVVMSTGADTLVLAGGIPKHFFDEDADHYVSLFNQGFLDNPVQRERLKDVSVYQIVNKDLGLLGCRYAAHSYFS